MSQEAFYEQYWSGLITRMKSRGITLEQRAPSKNARQVVGPTWAAGKIRIAAGVHRPARESHSIHVDVTLDTPTAKEWFARLRRHESEIKRKVGLKDGRWEWNERDIGRESHIILKRPAQPEDVREREEQYDWLADKLVLFHEAFGPRIEAMLAGGESDAE